MCALPIFCPSFNVSNTVLGSGQETDTDPDTARCGKAPFCFAGRFAGRGSGERAAQAWPGIAAGTADCRHQPPAEGSPEDGIGNAGRGDCSGGTAGRSGRLKKIF